MPANRKPNRQRVKIHRSYSVEEIACTLGVVKPTVRRWIKSGDLPALTDRKPMLILGADLADFLKRIQGAAPKMSGARMLLRKMSQATKAGRRHG